MPSGSSAFWVSDLHGMDSHSISTRRASLSSASNGQERLLPRAGGVYRLVSVQPASNHPGPARPSDDDDAGPLCLLRHLGQHQTIALVREEIIQSIPGEPTPTIPTRQPFLPDPDDLIGARHPLPAARIV